ncbi:GDSL-type esterase/lipase family protein [Actinomadura roseirufa]|uniref:GDSL-type esterase/lipase family protein n=1 Tax=Actinomadura roseirufa TaxID=2094049 RepID=UPI0010418F72|nr:GDSL-type esterase/lipase family protein [Actinomadura roseirufa]
MAEQRKPNRPFRGGFRRRAIAVLSLGMALTLMLGVGVPAPALAARRSAPLPTGPLKLAGIGELSVTRNAAEDVVFTLEVDSGIDLARLQRIVADEQAKDARLSDTIKQLFQTYQFNPRLDLTKHWQDFDGTLTATSTGVKLTIPGSQVRTEASWWQMVLAAVLGQMVYLASQALCIALAPELVVVCAAVGGFVGGFVAGVITQAFEGEIGSAKSWAGTLLVALLGAVGGSAWEGYVKDWAKNTLPGILKSIGEKSIELFNSLRNWLGALTDKAVAAGRAIIDIAGFIAAQLGGATIPSQGPSSLRIMPLGDSITYGTGSSTGNGYRERLRRNLVDRGYQGDFVGSVRSGTMPDPDNEGHPGWVISQIADAEHASVPGLRPTVVLIHAGTNDMDRNVDPEGAPARLAGLVDQTLRDAPNATVLVSTLVPSANAAVQTRIAAFNRQVRALVRRRHEAGGPVGLVDMTPVTTADLADGLHPNDRGYEKMGEAFYTGIQLARFKEWLKNPGGNGQICPAPGGRWLPRGKVASGVGPGAKVRFADMDGDGKDDYLVLNDDGSVDAWRNAGGDQDGRPGWIPMGKIASGVGTEPSDTVTFADIDGDRRDDYLVVHSMGQVDAWRNVGGDQNGRPGWIPMGRVASGTGEPGAVTFADIDGDLRDDYLVVQRTTAVLAWRNVGGDQDGRPGWIPMGKIASGVGTANEQVLFADVNCDDRDDYVLEYTGGELDAWRNAGGDQDGRPGWIPLGRIASGTGEPGSIALADLDGDGLDDYLVVAADGSVKAWLNQGGDPS